MPRFLSSCKACRTLFSGNDRASQFKLRLGLGLLPGGRGGEDAIRLDRFSQSRVLTSFARIGGVRGGNLVSNVACTPEEIKFHNGNLTRNFQIRRFLGCGDGDEGNVLSKTYEERRVIGYAPEQLFAVVEAVDMYEDFVPWCQRSKVLRRYENGSFDAELEIGFKFLVESYVSHVEMEKPKYIKTTASQSALFDHLINIWEFNPGPIAGTCDLHFYVDFKFQSPLYRQVASMFFKEVVSRLVGSFDDRCHRIYGPAIPIVESTYGQSSQR